MFRDQRGPIGEIEGVPNHEEYMRMTESQERTDLVQDRLPAVATVIAEVEIEQETRKHEEQEAARKREQ